MTKALSFAILLVACGTTPPVEHAGGPRGPRATDHLSEARRHDEVAKQQAMMPDTRAGSPADPPIGVWYRSWDTTDHERLAEIHRSHAGAIDAEFAEACAGLTGQEITMSPLQRFGMGGWNTTTGVIVYLSPQAGSADRLLAQLRCHRAWMMLGPSDMEDCPLDLPGLAVDVRGDAEGVTVSLVVRDPKLVGDLQQRTAKDLEAARR